ncbi:MAG: hypothetical protein ACD_39C01047G0001, partial [uncultured bacterium]
MSNNSAVSKDLPRENLIFKVDSDKAAETLAKSLRIIFWVDFIVLLANLFFLYSWMFDLGYLPDWQIISQLFFVNTIICIAQRRAFNPPKGHHSFQIAITDTGIILDDYYMREAIARESLQAIVMPARSGFLALKNLGLLIDGRVRILPEHIIDQARLVEELADRFSLPLIESAEAMRRGWQYSQLKIVAIVIGLSFITVSILAVIAEFTSGIVRMLLFLLLFITFMLAAHRFVVSLMHRPGAVVKRRNPATELALIPIMVFAAMTIFEAVNMADREQPVSVLPAASEFSSRLSIIDPPAIFAPILSGHITDDEIKSGFEEAVASWSAKDRSEYERILVETAANPDMITAKLERPSASSAGDLSWQPIRQIGRRHMFFRLLAPVVEREDLIVAIVRNLCLCAAELDAAQPLMYPGVAGSIPGTYRVSATNLLRQHLARSAVSRKTAGELIEFSRRLEAVLPDVATMLAVENICWAERLRMYNFNYRNLRTDLSRLSYYPEPDDERVRQLRTVLFEKPLPVLQRYETGLATFPAISSELERCRYESASLVISWGWRILDNLMLPYQLRNLIGAMNCTYSWQNIWRETICGRQHLHALGYI